jgi:hypothetical protein
MSHFPSRLPAERIITTPVQHRRPKSPLSPRIAPAVTLAPTSPNATGDRRRVNRDPLMSKATLIVLDGPVANSQHEILTRDLSLSGVSFLLKECLAVGWRCKLLIGSQTHHCEVVRSRPLSNGKWEMAVAFRRGA